MVEVWGLNGAPLAMERGVEPVVKVLETPSPAADDLFFLSDKGLCISIHDRLATATAS